MPLLFDKRRPILIGVIHLRPLPGSPRWNGNLPALIKAAVADAVACERGGVDGLIIENFGDVPFFKTDVPPETVAAMAAAARAIRESIQVPLGFNVLRNDARAALGLCAACGGSFIRVNVHTGAMITDQGLVEGRAGETLRLRQGLCPDALILADVHVKHAAPLGDWPIENAARDTLDRGLADALIVSGPGTGMAADVSDLERVRLACPEAKILIGSGITIENAARYAGLADGFIAATSLKRAGRVENPVDPKRVDALARSLGRVHKLNRGER